MMHHRRAVTFVLGWGVAVGLHAGCQNPECPPASIPPPPRCATLNSAKKTTELPDSVWLSVRNGQPQRLLVTIFTKDIVSVSRADQLAEYERRKQSIIQSLPRDAARVLRPLEQLPTLEIEVSTEEALRVLSKHCLVEEAYTDRQERLLEPTTTP